MNTFAAQMAARAASPEAPSELAYTFRYDYDGDNMIYEGRARSDKHPLTSQPVWYIVKRTFVNGNCVLEEKCDGNSFEDNVWDSRAALTYF